MLHVCRWNDHPRFPLLRLMDPLRALLDCYGPLLAYLSAYLRPLALLAGLSTSGHPTEVVLHEKKLKVIKQVESPRARGSLAHTPRNSGSVAVTPQHLRYSASDSRASHSGLEVVLGARTLLRLYKAGDLPDGLCPQLSPAADHH